MDYNAGNCLLTRKPASQYSISHQTAKLCWYKEWFSDMQSGWYTELGEDWLLASVIKYTIVTDHTWQQWSLLNHFRTEQGHCDACRRKWRLSDTDLCPCGETQTMSHIVESCPLTKLNDSLSRLRSADEDAVSWLTNYG